jgi:hypothetical protein
MGSSLPSRKAKGHHFGRRPKLKPAPLAPSVLDNLRKYKDLVSAPLVPAGVMLCDVGPCGEIATLFVQFESASSQIRRYCPRHDHITVAGDGSFKWGGFDVHSVLYLDDARALDAS